MEQQIKITHTSNADMNIGIPKNLTAVEWLLEELWNNKHLKVFPTAEYQQAKQIEKEHIIHTYWVAYKEGRYSGDKTAEEYYNETYNK